MMTMSEEYRFRDIIAPAFYGAHRDLKHGRHSEYWFKGGRGSAKSSFVSAEIVKGMIDDPLANAIIYRRVGNTIKDSVYAQMIWAIDMMGLSAWFEYRKSPFEIIYKPTGQRILFRGADDPMKSKSIKLTKGYFKYCWFEELSEFRCMDDARTILQSVFRGVNKAFTFYSYNPPKTASAWVNKEALEPPKERFVHSSTYLDVPKEWLGEKFIGQAESLKETNELAYRNEYLGDVTGTGGNVFENVKVRPIPKEELDTLQWFYQGIDWGWFPDPFAWNRCAYDSRKRILYVVDEYHANKKSNLEVYGEIKSKLNPDESLIADSAEPKSIGDFRDYGAYWIRGANKGVVGTSGSVAYSTKWLASLKEIVIDENKCPETAKEFLAYEYERNSAGEFINGFVDKNNHHIDCLRYSTSPIWRRQGE